MVDSTGITIGYTRSIEMHGTYRPVITVHPEDVFFSVLAKMSLMGSFPDHLSRV